MDTCREFVRRFEDAMAVTLPAPPPPPPARATPTAAPVALLFSPHPDDEVITGALALRLQREAGARVVNVAVTLGSNRARREERRREVAAACALLGWDLEVWGCEGVVPEAVQREPVLWEGWTCVAAEAIARWRPRWVFYPHGDDGHPTHIGTHLLAQAALARAADAGGPERPWRILTEYWHPLKNPNLLVECPPELLATLIAALCCHRGEIARNPYHLTLPAWLLDNVRRGAERIGGAGATAPTFPFGTLYRVEPCRPPGWDAILPASLRLTA
jgi:LmbE family N-acetylglucosaminyl deacetylase